MAVLSFALILHAILLGSAALLPLVAAVPAELYYSTHLPDETEYPP
jgi:hypothetical protein